MDFNDKMYDLVQCYLEMNGITDTSFFKLSNDGDGRDSKIEKWAYKIPQPSKDELLKIMPNLTQKNSCSGSQLNNVDKPELEPELSLFFSNGELCVMLDGKIRKILLS